MVMIAKVVAHVKLLVLSILKFLRIRSTFLLAQRAEQQRSEAQGT